MMPSWKISVQSGDSEPARMPPMSLKCAQRLREGGELAFREHGRDEHLVGRMRDGALGGVAVVEPVDVAGTHGVERVVLGDGADHVAEHRQVGADDQAAGAVEQGGIEVFLLADERRHGRALDHRLHLALDGAQRAAHDLQRDGVADGLLPDFAESCAICLISPQRRSSRS